jgi:hypothetical protein
MMAIKTVSAVDRPALVLLGGTSDSLAFASLHVLRLSKFAGRNDKVAAYGTFCFTKFFELPNVVADK